MTNQTDDLELDLADPQWEYDVNQGEVSRTFGWVIPHEVLDRDDCNEKVAEMKAEFVEAERNKRLAAT